MKGGSDLRAGEPRGPHAWAWLLLAWLALGLAALGVLLPGLPTTPFVLLAAWAAARGSRRLHDWLLAHRLFGRIIDDWQTHGAVRRSAKRWATAMMLLCTVVLLVFAPHWSFAAVGAGAMSTVALWLWRRPEPASSSTANRPCRAHDIVELEKQKKKAAKANRKAAAAGEDTATNDPSEPAGANADSAAQPD